MYIYCIYTYRYPYLIPKYPVFVGEFPIFSVEAQKAATMAAAWNVPGTRWSPGIFRGGSARGQG